MSTQRKLTDEELQVVMDSRFCVRQLAKFLECQAFCLRFLTELDDAARHATTDGKPYVDPQPPIPDGYRLAVKGDEGRKDCKIWCDSESRFVNRPCVGDPFGSDGFYIVPTDRTPTDEDAKSRPVVMVRDTDTQKWQPETLVFVRNCEHSKYKFATTDKFKAEIICWRHCRFLYPGE